MVPVHYLSVRVARSEMSTGLQEPWGVVWLVTYLIVLLGLSLWFRRSTRFQAGLRGFAEKVTPLSLAYLLLDFVSLLIVVYRYLARSLA
jgi:hypothetical protein